MGTDKQFLGPDPDKISTMGALHNLLSPDSNPHTAILLATPLASQVDTFLQQANPATYTQLEPAYDPVLAHNLQRFNFNIGGDVRLGRVQMSLPHANWYRVVIEGLSGELPCIRVGEGGYRLMGVSDSSNIAPDSTVVVMMPKLAHYGFIIGTVPELVEDGNHTYSDWVSQGSNVGILKQKYHTEYMRLLSDEGGALVHSGGRPLDALSFDWTKVAETGIGLHIDPFMFWARVDEECGIQGFYHDRLLRIAGYNLDLWSAARLEEDRNDEGELYVIKGEAMYPWEMLGSYKAEKNISRTVDDEDVLHNEPYAKLEPIEDDLQPFTRYQEYGGYLGQGHIRAMALPPDGKADADAIRRWEATDADLGVFREHIGLDGAYSLEAAKHVYIAKRGLIPIPKQIKPCDDYSQSDADSRENNNYKFSGKDGGGADHRVGDLQINDENRTMYSAAAILDLHSYAFNWKSLMAFHYHENDYNLPQEDELVLEKVQYLPEFSELERYMWLQPPAAKEMKVDHRYNNVKYWEMLQHISMTDDGAIIIQGGQGEEIRLAGGNIQISAPGKILIQSGNTTAIMAGDDFIAKAYNSADITATKHDIRLKAENNLMALAGNSGEGVLQLENRATSVKYEYPSAGGESIKGSGIVLKAKDTHVSLLGKDVYVRAGVSGSGQIVLDSGEGNGDIRMVANNIDRFVRGRIRDGFGLPTTTSVNVYRQGETIFNNTVKVKGQMLVDGFGMFRQSIYAVNGHFSSQSGGQVTRLRNRQALNAQIDAMETYIAEQRSDHRKDYRYEIDEKYYQEGQIGNKETIKKVSFSLRDEKEYGTLEFVLPQTHWQILNNVVNAGKSWVETDVEYQSGKQQQPWPGKKAWSEQETLRVLGADKFKFYDLEAGQSKERSSATYGDTTLNTFTRAKPSSAYTIIPNVE